MYGLTPAQVRNCLIVEPVAATAADFYNTLELLSKVAAHSPAGTQIQLQLQQLVMQARNRSHVPADVINDGTDPPGLKEQVGFLWSPSPGCLCTCFKSAIHQ